MEQLITVKVDHAQWRIKEELLSSTVTGTTTRDRATKRQVDGYSSSYMNYDADGDPLTWIEPVTSTLMLRPLCLTRAWLATPGPGEYAKLGIADYTLVTPANWEARGSQSSGSIYLCKKDVTINEAVVTNTTWGVDQAFYLGMWIYGIGQERRVLLECGWDGATGFSASVGLRFYTDGEIEVWRNGELRQVYANANLFGSGQSIQNKWVKLLLIPCRKNQLIISLSDGTGIVHTFTEIDPESGDPITPANKFFWYYPGAANVECAPMRFRASGYRGGITSYFAKDIEGRVTPVTFRKYFDEPAGTSVTPTLEEVLDNHGRIKHALATSNTLKTPFVYATVAQIEAERTITDSLDVADVTPYIRRDSFSLTVSDDPDGVRVNFTLQDWGELEEVTGGTRRLNRIDNRPFSFDLDELQIIDCHGSVPKEIPSTHEDLDELQFQLSDRWACLKRYRFRDRIPLDGMSASAAIEFVALSAGISALELDLESIAVTIGSTVPPSQGDFTFEIEPGQFAADVIMRIHSEYIADCFIGFVPTSSGPRLKVIQPETMDETSTFDLFSHPEDALVHLQTTLFYTEEEARKRVHMYTCNIVDFDWVPPEANEVTVTGIDQKTGRPLSSRKVDGSSQDPTVSVGARSDEWSGDINNYGLISSLLTTQGLTSSGAERLFKRLAFGRQLMLLDAPWVIVDGIPAWRGDVGTIHYRREADEEAVQYVVRIKSYTANLVLEPQPDDPTTQWRRARYLVQVLIPLEENDRGASPTGMSALTASVLKEAMRAAGPGFGILYSRTAGATQTPPRTSSNLI